MSDGKIFREDADAHCSTAIKTSNMFTVLKSAVCLRTHIPTSNNSPRRKTDELKTTEDGPTPRSLM